MKEKLKIYSDLFVTFAKIGAVTFGGGIAMLPILERELVDNKKWVDMDEIMDYYAVGQCTPGIIAVNTATFVGNKMAGNWGGIAATMGIVFPSLVIISLIATLLTQFQDIVFVQKAFAGIRVCVCVLILNSVIKLWKSSIKDKASVVIALLVAALSFFFDISPIIFVLCCAPLGILLVKAGIKGK